MFDVFASARSRSQNLYWRNPPAEVNSRNQPLRNDVTKSLSQTSANNRLLIFWIESNNAIDCLRSINRVERRQNQMTSLGCFQGDFGSFVIAHFSDQDYLGRLSQRSAQSRRKVFRIVTDFSLIDCRVLVRVKIFDRIFDRDDMIVLCLVNYIDHRCERRALTGTRWSGNQNQSVA